MVYGRTIHLNIAKFTIFLTTMIFIMKEMLKIGQLQEKVLGIILMGNMKGIYKGTENKGMELWFIRMGLNSKEIGIMIFRFKASILIMLANRSIIMKENGI
jgi:hypothetical protein